MALVPRRRRGAGAIALLCVVSIAPAGGRLQQDEVRTRIKEAASLLGKRATADALKILEPLAADPVVTADPALLGEVQYHTGNARFMLNEYPKAIGYFERARESSRKAGDRTAEGRAFFREAQAHKNMGQYDVALEEARQAVTLYDSVSNRALTASAWTVVGGIQDLMGRYREALQSYDTASRLFEGTKAPAANSLLNETAITYKNLGDYDKALVFYNRALEGHVGTGDRYSQGVTLLNIGNLLSILGQDDRALESVRAGAGDLA